MTEPPPQRLRVVLVAALARDFTIGVDGGLPWHYPDDLKRFKQDTLGTALIMGRKTLESIGRALPKRPNIVLTRDPEALERRFAGITAVSDLDAAFAAAAATGLTTVSVIGGGQIYGEALSRADVLLLTHVPQDGGGDTFFPRWDSTQFEECEREAIGDLTRVVYERVR